MRIRNVEDYLEVIYSLESEKGKIRVSDIAKQLGIRPSSVTEMIQKLQKEGFITYERYTPINLTEKGTLLAKSVVKRHKILKTFLQLLGINDEIADRDACEIEHIAHPETLARLTSFINFIKQVAIGQECLNIFKSFHAKHFHSSEVHLNKDDD